MAIGDLALVVAELRGAGQVFQNTFGFKAISAGATLTNLVADFRDAAIKNTSGGLLYPLTDDVGCAYVRAVDVVPGTQANVEESFAEVLGAGNTSEPLPFHCAVVITWRTGLAGRSYRGRTYLTGAAEDQQNAGQWSSAFLAVVATFPVNMLATFGPTGSNANWQLVVISRVANGVERATPIGTAITGYAVRQPVYTQTRRVIGRGS